MFQALRSIMNLNHKWSGTDQSLHDIWDLLQVLYSEFLNEYCFINYFRDEWREKIGA